MKKLTLKKNLININIYSGHSATIHFFTSIAMQKLFLYQKFESKKDDKKLKNIHYI